MQVSSLAETIAHDLLKGEPSHREGPRICANCFVYFVKSSEAQVMVFDMGAYCYCIVESSSEPCRLKVIDGDDNSHSYDLNPRSQDGLAVSLERSFNQLILSLVDKSGKDPAILLQFEMNKYSAKTIIKLFNRLEEDLNITAKSNI